MGINKTNKQTQTENKMNTDHIDLAIAAEEIVKKAGWRISNNHTAASGSFYFCATKLVDGEEVYDENNDVIDFSVRVASHSCQSSHMGTRGGVDVNIFNDYGLEELSQKLAVLS
jgi:hypothetical protein